MELYRQGDVLLERVSGKPKGEKQPPKGNEVILEYGEVTGHRHRIEVQGAKDNTAMLFVEGTRQYLELCFAKDLIHEEHDTIALPAGTYKRHAQVTWSVLEQMAARVID